MPIGATDQQRSLFLKGFRLSKQGNYEDPTYLGFKVLFDFGVLPIGTEDGLPPSPLLKEGSYLADTGSNTLVSRNPFGQPQYNYLTPGSQGNIGFYSATEYLRQREDGFATGGKRADMIRQFINNLKNLCDNYPWFLQSIGGLETLANVQRPGFPSAANETFSSQRTKDKVLEFRTLESLNMRMTALAHLYNQATFDYDNMRELLPRNLRRFTMYIFVTEIRNFFKTSRLIGSSTTLQTIDNLSTLLGTGNNPGTNLGVASGVSDINREYTAENSSTNPASSFNSFVGNILNNAGLDNEYAMFRNQQDQSGIKPVIIFECKNCEFDFSESTPLTNNVSQGSETPTPAGMTFKIHVGKVRVKAQFPNIRQDGKPLVLADSWDGARSSVQSIPKNNNDLLSLGGEVLSNFISNSLNDLINEGVASLANNTSGINQVMMGNAYSFDPSAILGRLSFNSAQNFLNDLGNVTSTQLPNPQLMGEGGPPERVYTPPSGDVYELVPGRDLGVPERVYAAPNEDVYANVPGSDLGSPDRVYPAPSGDAYDKVPGTDLGVPDRVYPEPSGDVYDQVPGTDLGVPNRVYPAPSGDVYDQVPGTDLGVPDRVYPDVNEDVYNNVPGSDLGVPERNYGSLGGDVYSKVPGPDLGAPERRYNTPTGNVYLQSDANQDPNKFTSPEKVYPETGIDTSLGIGQDKVYPDRKIVYANGELRDPSNTFSSLPSPVYEPSQRVPKKQRGSMGIVYPTTSGNFIVEKPLNLGDAKPADKFNISTGQLNPDKTEFNS